MQSQDYMPEVSGWKSYKDGRLEVCGAIRMVLPEGAQKESLPPFIVIEGVTYIRQADIRLILES